MGIAKNRYKTTVAATVDSSNVQTIKFTGYIVSSNVDDPAGSFATNVVAKINSIIKEIVVSRDVTYYNLVETLSDYVTLTGIKSIPSYIHQTADSNLLFTFDDTMNQASEINGPFSIVYNVKLKDSLRDLTATDYTVATDSHLSCMFEADGTAIETDDKAFWPVQIQRNYDITYDENGGSAVDDQTKLHGNNLTLSGAPTKSGYDFLGWKDSVSGTTYGAAATYTANKDVALTAQWGTAAQASVYNRASACADIPTATARTFVQGGQSFAFL